MSFVELIQGRSEVDKRQEEGLDLALDMLKDLKDRTFRVKGKGINARAVPDEEALRFLQEELPEYYQYQTSVLSYSKKRTGRHVQIHIEGWLGIRRELRRYSPLDIRLLIATE